jgi:hypothetical protein
MTSVKYFTTSYACPLKFTTVKAERILQRN